ncbi:MAG: glycosyltransferase family 39 protein [Acidobacteriota bacterium]
MSRGRIALLAALLVAAASFLLVRDHAREDALSADEPVHILAGYFEVFGRTAIVNIEHPPLMKLLAGLGLKTLPLPDPPARVPMGNRFTDFGHAFLFENRVSPDAIAAAARAPFRWLLVLLLLLVFFEARARHGPAPALFATALLAFDPNFLAHAGVVHTDLGAAVGFFATVLAWDRAARKPGTARLALAAIVLGLSLATKFSAVYLLPILLLQGLLAARRAKRPGREAARMLLRLSAATAGALLVVVGIYAAVTSRMNPEDQRQIIWEMVGQRGAPRLARAIQEVARVSPSLGHYLGGLGSVARQNVVGGGVNYLLGKASVEGFPQYFFVAFFAKSTLAFLAATLIALLGAAVRRSGEEAELLLTPVAVLFVASIGSSYNIGIRHMLPVYPFLALAAAGTLARMQARAGRAAAAGAGLLLLLPLSAGIEAARIHPHELSYFNPLVGGPEEGRFVLSDSNVDWGLDLRRLAAELRRRGVRDPTVVYFGGDDVAYRVGVPDFSAEPWQRGSLVAVSAMHLAIGPLYYAYHGAPEVGAALQGLLREVAARGTPAGRVGYSIYLFQLPRKGMPRP